ncbi:AraC family transcriptional regulator [Niabella pedocola]|uniref:AraC family transcriptional regulator n=1 Tax=Niabella pedocola TaxID=1752077 RepID=A0ABS8PNA7_9BACT|nr:AraC family transcriptional regulator [Niabella pedocola]MCD2422595.1 AraC family transcriptional regulator [Niabella pedocola]
MKPQLLKVPTEPQNSFSLRKDSVPYINNRWHLHAELELIYFKKGKGTQYIGDNISTFREGDVVLVGSNLPHYWRFADSFFEDNPQTVDVRVVHFSQHFLGKHFLELPENLEIKEVLERSKRGLQIKGAARGQIGALLEQLSEAEGSQRILLMLKALTMLAAEKQCFELSSVGFRPDFRSADENERLQAILDYSAKHFKRKITLEEIADIANISPSSFCRYFKSRTRKTYSRYLIELRVGYACRLLIETNTCLKRLCFESGFNNFTSFHKYFKIITGRSPMIYQKEFLV